MDRRSFIKAAFATLVYSTIPLSIPENSLKHLQYPDHMLDSLRYMVNKEAFYLVGKGKVSLIEKDGSEIVLGNSIEFKVSLCS